MRTFKDDLGREWQLKITPVANSDIRDQLKVDLQSWDDPPYERLAADPELLAKVIWHLVKEQAAAAGVSERDLGEQISGETIDRITTALLDAVNDSFHSSKRSLRRSLLEKTAALGRQGAELALAKLDDPETKRRLLARMLEKMNSTIDGVSIESPASQSDIPAPSSATDSADEMPSLRAFG